MCVANRQVRSTVNIVKTSLSRNGNGFIENPRTSLLWGYLQRVFKKEIAAGTIFFTDCTMCAYGTPWKKPTTFMLWGSHVGDVNLRSCNSRSICSFSCKAHEQLSSATRVLIDGKVKDKCFATKKGQVYPNRLVKDLLNQLLHLQ